jgi:hypothetical protein
LLEPEHRSEFDWAGESIAHSATTAELPGSGTWPGRGQNQTNIEANLF